MRQLLSDRFATRTRDEWAAHFAGTEACVTPVLSFAEAADDPHLAARATLVEADGIVQAAPAPRFSRTAPSLPGAPHPADPAEILNSWKARD
jgi:alpha-methylacyl-CoA racemase